MLTTDYSYLLTVLTLLSISFYYTLLSATQSVYVYFYYISPTYYSIATTIIFSILIQSLSNTLFTDMILTIYLYNLIFYYLFYVILSISFIIPISYYTTSTVCMLNKVLYSHSISPTQFFTKCYIDLEYYPKY